MSAIEGAAATGRHLDANALPGESARNRLGLMAIIGFSYAILNSWPAMTGSLSVVLPSGGPTAVIYGLLTSFIGVGCMALSLAEITYLLPLPGGVYHYAYVLCRARRRQNPHLATEKGQLSAEQQQAANARNDSLARGLSYLNGWINTAAWVAVTATASSIFAQFITGIIVLLHPNFSVQAWQTFLIYVAQALGAWAINVFLVRALDGVNKAALYWSLLGALIIVITCLARSSGQYQSGKFVFATYINNTGWNNGVAWILGLLQSAFGLTAVDGVTHMVEEIPRPEINAPLAMLLAVVLGSASSLIVLIVFLFTLTDFNAVVDSPACLLTVLDQATHVPGGGHAAAVALIMFPVVSMCFAATSILTASSRQTQAFARDRGLPFWPIWEKQNKKLDVPVYAISLTTFFVIVFGCIYLGSSSALNAILSSSVVNFQISYCVPVAILMVRGRGLLDDMAGGNARRYDLGRAGYLVNTIALVFNIFTSVFFFFPPELPVSGSSMNYVIVVEGVVLLMAALTWIFQGRKTFEGPLDIDLLLARNAKHRIVLNDADDAKAAHGSDADSSSGADAPVVENEKGSEEEAGKAEVTLRSV